MAFRGSRRLINGLDIYVPWLFQFLFKIQRPTLNLVSDSTPWLVIRKTLPLLPLLDARKFLNHLQEALGLISAMTNVTDRATADVLIYCGELVFQFLLPYW